MHRVRPRTRAQRTHADSPWRAHMCECDLNTHAPHTCTGARTPNSSRSSILGTFTHTGEHDTCVMSSMLVGRARVLQVPNKLLNLRSCVLFRSPLTPVAVLCWAECFRSISSIFCSICCGEISSKPDTGLSAMMSVTCRLLHSNLYGQTAISAQQARREWHGVPRTPPSCTACIG